jgi:hypothetical protein
MTPKIKAARLVTAAAQITTSNAANFNHSPTTRQARKTALPWFSGYHPTALASETRNSHEAPPSNGLFRGKAHPRLNGQRNQCGSCGELFHSNAVFDAHRTGRYEPDERRCLTATQMQARGFTCPDGFWRSPISEDDRERLVQLRRQS